MGKADPEAGATATYDSAVGHPQHEVRYRQKINIQAHDGTVQCANLFAPDTDNPGQTFSAIVFINSWCMDKHQYLLQARRFARNGYLVLSYSARGWVLSGGVVEVGGPGDMRDVSTVIDWLINNTPVQADNIGFSWIFLDFLWQWLVTALYAQGAAQRDHAANAYQLPV